MSQTSGQTTGTSSAKHAYTENPGLTHVPSESPVTTVTRSDLLRHVLPLRARDRTSRACDTSTRITKGYHCRDHHSRGLRMKPRAAFQKYITSFFSSSNNSTSALNTPLSRSRPSSVGTRPDSSLQGSVPSVDLVSPTAFVFSGPSLHSSTSRLPSLGGTCSEVQFLRRTRTNSFSMLGEADFLEEKLLEPIPGEGVTRNMADILLGACATTEGLMSPVKYGLTGALSSVHTGGCGSVSHISLNMWQHGGSKLRTLAILLLPFLDIGA